MKTLEFEQVVALRAIFVKEIFDPKKCTYIILLLIQKEQVTSHFSECKNTRFRKDIQQKGYHSTHEIKEPIKSMTFKIDHNLYSILKEQFHHKGNRDCFHDFKNKGLKC